ncbi:MAG: hypothetical protein AAGJ87_16665, partial [Pseudomonadota bacterium]
MRRILLTFSSVCALFFEGAAVADQTDSRLDALFAELRTGDAIDAQETTDRIVDIWADAPSDTIDVLYGRAKASADAG